MKVIAYLFSVVAVLGALGVPQAVFAQAKPVMNWAGDAEGGAPYQFPDPGNPSKIIGFEVDMAEALAQRLGRRAHFIQNQWDGLVPGHERSEYDIVIAGLEVNTER